MAKRHRWHTYAYADFGPSAPDEPSWDHTRMLIGWLNGRDRTDVFLGEEGGRYLAIAGGNAGRYIVAVQEPERYYHLARRPGSGERKDPVEVVVGGLPDFYPPVLVHPLPIALEVAEHYFRTGRRARRFQWVRGGMTER